MTEPEFSPPIASAQPIWADQHENGRTRTERALDRLLKILAGPYRGDIMEDMLVAEMLSEVRNKTPGPASGIVAAIAEKDSAHADIPLRDR